MTTTSSVASSAPSRAGAASTVLVAGLAAAAVEMAFVLPIQAALRNSPLVVFQSIAAGALGRAAYSAGIASAAVGLAAHILVSLTAAAVYLWAAMREPVLERRPIAGGMIFGALVYPVMTMVVIPLSRIGFTPPKSAVLWATSFSVHVLAFGLPIAVAVAWMRHGRLHPTS